MHFRKPVSVILLTAIAAVLLCGCQKRSGAGPVYRVDTYTVRGVLMAMPIAGAEPRIIQVRHEAIPEFRSTGGKLGMDAMQMPFVLGEGVDVTGLAPGAVIEVTFDVKTNVDEDRLVESFVTKILRLPDNTELDFNPRPSNPG